MTETLPMTTEELAQLRDEAESTIAAWPSGAWPCVSVDAVTMVCLLDMLDQAQADNDRTVKEAVNTFECYRIQIKELQASEELAELRESHEALISEVQDLATQCFGLSKKNCKLQADNDRLREKVLMYRATSQRAMQAQAEAIALGDEVLQLREGLERLRKKYDYAVYGTTFEGQTEGETTTLAPQKPIHVDLRQAQKCNSSSKPDGE